MQRRVPKESNTHSQGFFKVFLRGFINVSPPGVELVLPSWKVVTASPPSRTFSPPGVEPGVGPVLPSWKVGVVTASPPSRTFSPPGVELVLLSWKVGVVTASPPSRNQN